MAPSSTEALAERGYTVALRGGRLHVSPAGAPPEIVDEVRRHPRELISELLRVPDRLAGWSLDDMRALAFTMQGYIDGPAPYEERIAFLPEFERLSERISWRMETTP
jgi:hypothetical protein